MLRKPAFAMLRKPAFAMLRKPAFAMLRKPAFAMLRKPAFAMLRKPAFAMLRKPANMLQNRAHCARFCNIFKKSMGTLVPACGRAIRSPIRAKIQHSAKNSNEKAHS
ncbi:hypothetical protein [Dictyobacter alpinus]|uniref:hypothetical protein n=1 Tax=Dictyobacter alpinus TaxID=2014873 RepID=UPI001387499F|nr:hypothetical protein [Dictyobacter alpinus]